MILNKNLTIKHCDKTLRKSILKICRRRLSQKVKDKKCLNTKKTISDGMFLNKELCANGISLRVETRIALLDEEHLIDETVKFPSAVF